MVLFGVLRRVVFIILSGSEVFSLRKIVIMFQTLVGEKSWMERGLLRTR